MKTLLALFVFAVLIPLYFLPAQVPLVGPPVKLDIGIGGGLSQPTGSLSDQDKTGWHAGAIARISGLMPLNLVASVHYNKLQNKPWEIVPAGLVGPSGQEYDIAWMAGAGLEYALPSPVVKPYLGLDAMLNVMSNTGADSVSTKRGGLGIGAGVQVPVPMVGTVDAQVKYQIFNLVGKEEGEENISQIVARISLMFSIL